MKASQALPEQHDFKAAILAATNMKAPLEVRKSVVQKSLLRYLDHLERLENVAKGEDPWEMTERFVLSDDPLSDL